MKHITGLSALVMMVIALFGASCGTSQDSTASSAIAGKNIYDFKVKDISGNEVALADFKGKTLLIVNVASKCGFTPQYEDLQALYDEYGEKGLVVLGFPANNFMGQEPGSNEEIDRFCTSKFGVTFPMFSKISVKGNDIHPLYQYLTAKSNQAVKWNFQKFLITKNGEVKATFLPKERVTDEKIKSTIVKTL